MIRHIYYLLFINVPLLIGKFNVPGTNVCKKTSLELTNHNGEKIYIMAEKLSITNDLCKMENLSITSSDGIFKADYGEINPHSLSGYISKNVSFKNKPIESSLDKIFIDLSKKFFHTTDKVISKIQGITVKSDGITYDKTKSEIKFLKNVIVKIN